jgi:ABC-2 type transport system ATP-binding protein
MAAEARADNGKVIEARGLSRRFGSFVAVDGIDVTVGAGEVFGLLGANGAGKTTAIRMLCGTLPPSAGSVSVAGMDMVRHARRARGCLGYVAQRFALYGDLTVMENLTLQAGLYGLDGRARRERIDWALAHLVPATWPGRCRSATSAASPWPPPCCTARGCCSSTSPPQASTRWRGSTSGS